MIDALAEGKRIELRDFGNFQVRHYPPRKRRNPMQGGRISQLHNQKYMLANRPRAVVKWIISMEDNMKSITGIRTALWRAGEIAPAGFALGLHFKAMGPSLVFQAYPPEWLAIYNSKGLALVDPAARYTLAENGACRWSALEEPDTAGVLEQGRMHGLNFGVSIGMDDGSTHSGAGFARSDREFTDDEIQHLQEVTLRIHRLSAPEANLDEVSMQELQKLAKQMSHPSWGS